MQVLCDQLTLQKGAELNTILDRYDSEVKFAWNEYPTLVVSGQSAFNPTAAYVLQSVGIGI